MNKQFLLWLAAIVAAIAAGSLFLRTPKTRKTEHAKEIGIEIHNVGGNKSESKSTVDSSEQGDGQAARLLGKAASGVNQFRNLPFKPEYGDETFDDTKPLSEAEIERWKRHCRLRDTYASERIHEPAFLEIYELVHQFNLDDDMVTLCYLNNIAYGLSNSLLHATDYSPELVSASRKKELEEFLVDSIKRYRNILTTIFGEEVDDGFIAALMEIHPNGGIGDPSTHIEPGERLLIN